MVGFFILLFTVWVIFSGYLSPFFLFSGIIGSIIIIYLISRYTEINFYRPSFKWVQYTLWLFYQMILSTLSTTKIVWQRNPTISPNLKKIRHNQKESNKIAILANSITLTPGTITVHHDKDYLYVHVLVEEGAIEGINKIISQLK